MDRTWINCNKFLFIILRLIMNAICGFSKPGEKDKAFWYCFHLNKRIYNELTSDDPRVYYPDNNELIIDTKNAEGWNCRSITFSMTDCNGCNYERKAFEHCVECEGDRNTSPMYKMLWYNNSQIFIDLLMVVFGWNLCIYKLILLY